MTETLWEGAEVKVTASRTSNRAAVATFTSRGKGVAREGFGEAFLKRSGFSGIHFISKTNHWWQTHDMLPALEAVNAYLVRHRLSLISTYGSSMGGHGALLFASSLEAERVVAFSPQTWINREDVPMMPVWRDDLGDRETLFELTPELLEGRQVNVVYDPFFSFDKKHVEALSGIASIKRHHVAFAGHSVAMYLADCGVLPRYARDMIRSGEVSRHVLAEVRARRAHSFEYLSELKKRTQSKPILRSKIEQRQVSLVRETATADGARVTSAALTTLLSLRRVLAAGVYLGIADEFVAKDPSSAMAQLIRAELYWAAGSSDAALEAVAQAIRLNRKDVRPRLLKASIEVQDGDLKQAANTIETALSFKPSAGRDWARLARLCRTSGLSPLTVKAVYERAIFLRPSDSCLSIELSNYQIMRKEQAGMLTNDEFASAARAMAPEERLEARERLLAQLGFIQKLIRKNGQHFARHAHRFTTSQVEDCRVLGRREELLSLVKPGGVCAEVGVAAGVFSKKIIEQVRPKVLHLFDVSFSKIDVEFYKPLIETGTVVLHKGDSSSNIAALVNVDFDFIYIDGDHSYDGVKRDIAASIPRLVSGGIIGFNDYTAWGLNEMMPYGVMDAVNELCGEHDWSVVGLSLAPNGHHDIFVKGG